MIKCQQLYLKIQILSPIKCVQVHQIRLVQHWQNKTPTITVPKYQQIQPHSKIRKVSKGKRLRHLRGGNRGTPIITSGKQEINHYLGQSYGKFSKIPLVSDGWNRYGHNGESFHIRPTTENPSFDQRPIYTPSFSELGLRSDVAEACAKLGFKIPTLIQSNAIPDLLLGRNGIIAAETGSGKTVAFLAPILHHVLNTKEESEIKEDGVDIRNKYNTPRALVITPGRELTKQIYDVAEEFGKHLGVNVRFAVGGNIEKKIASPPVSEVDILVGSMGCLHKLKSAGIYHFRHLHHVVLDEADTLLDDSFNELVLGFVGALGIQGVKPAAASEMYGTQLVMAAATMPSTCKKLLSYITHEDSVCEYSTRHLHCIPPHIKQKFIKVNGLQKADMTVDLVNTDVNNGHTVVIFANKNSTVHYLSHILDEHNIPHITITGDVDYRSRIRLLEDFHMGSVRVLCCSDVMSRGIDTQTVRHVINYDCPRHMSDYVHRVGRTGRVGGDFVGRVTTLVHKKPEVNLVKEIEMCVRKGVPLTGMNPNIKRSISKVKSNQGGEQPVDYTMFNNMGA